MAVSGIPSRGAGGGLAAPAGGLVDEMVTRYAAWSEDAAAVAAAYSRWSEASPAQEVERFAAYMAALDQEQASASTYAHSVGEVERWMPGVRTTP